MTLVQAKESKYANKCSRKDCQSKTVIGKPYVWDTEANKAYCSKECAEMVTNQKVVDNSGNGKSKGMWTPKIQQFWRSPDESVTAIKLWHETVIPMISQTTSKITGKPFMNVMKIYEEIFLGKMQDGSKP